MSVQPLNYDTALTDGWATDPTFIAACYGTTPDKACPTVRLSFPDDIPLLPCGVNDGTERPTKAVVLDRYSTARQLDVAYGTPRTSPLHRSRQFPAEWAAECAGEQS